MLVAVWSRTALSRSLAGSSDGSLGEPDVAAANAEQTLGADLAGDPGPLLRNPWRWCSTTSGARSADGKNGYERRAEALVDPPEPFSYPRQAVSPHSRAVGSGRIEETKPPHRA